MTLRLIFQNAVVLDAEQGTLSLGGECDAVDEVRRSLRDEINTAPSTSN